MWRHWRLWHGSGNGCGSEFLGVVAPVMMMVVVTGNNGGAGGMVATACSVLSF